MIPHRKIPQTDNEPWEQEIDAALQLLNLAEPPTGMQERLQRRVPALAAQRLPTAVSSYRKAFSAVFAAVATLACACLLLALAQHVHRARVTAPSRAQTLTPQAPMAGTAPASSPATLSTPTFAPAPTQIFHLALTTQAPRRQTDSPVAAQEPSLPTQAQLDAQALADTQAPSHPAPTLELTAQERQAILMARRGERRNLASLDPANQLSRAQQIQTDFQNFLHPVLTPLQKQVEQDAERVQAGLPLLDHAPINEPQQTQPGKMR